jgi:hypothetical protein
VCRRIDQLAEDAVQLRAEHIVRVEAANAYLQRLRALRPLLRVLSLSTVRRHGDAEPVRELDQRRSSLHAHDRLLQS